MLYRLDFVVCLPPLLSHRAYVSVVDCTGPRPGNDRDLVAADGASDLVPRGADGQLGRVDDDGFDRHSLPAYRCVASPVAERYAASFDVRAWIGGES